jgi:hypothetical protein
MRRAIRLLVVGLFALVIVVPAASLASASVAHSGVSVVAAVDQPPTATPPATAPAGPSLNPQQAPNKSKQKLVIGIFAAVLLVIVFFGRRSRNKRRKKAASATVT